MFRFLILILALVVMASSAAAQCPRCGKFHAPYNGVQAAGAYDALAEVNTWRARRGLRAFIHDPGLTQAASACAQVRAARRIEGHLPNDFAYLPAGTTASSAGCGAASPSWGWLTCCMEENYTYAGAAWVWGSDGQRYMHLFVR